MATLTFNVLTGTFDEDRDHEINCGSCHKIRVARRQIQDLLG